MVPVCRYQYMLCVMFVGHLLRPPAPPKNVMIDGLLGIPSPGADAGGDQDQAGDAGGHHQEGPQVSYLLNRFYGQEL